MPIAYNLLSYKASYRRDTFTDGLAKLGFVVRAGPPPPTDMNPQDVLLVWNMRARDQIAIGAAHRAGAAILVAENGYAGVDGAGVQNYALALGGHNGSGRWHRPAGDLSRLRMLGVVFEPPRPPAGAQGPVLVIGQRGIGSAAMRSPERFDEHAAGALRSRWPGRAIVVRPHPGANRLRTAKPLGEDLRDAAALVTWASNCATEALRLGVPVHYAAPALVTAPACHRFTPDLLGAVDPQAREAAFADLSWAQWSLGEVATGEPIRLLLDVHAGRLPSCREPI